MIDVRNVILIGIHKKETSKTSAYGGPNSVGCLWDKKAFFIYISEKRFFNLMKTTRRSD